MSCERFAPWISRYLDEDLEGGDLEAFLDHLQGCPGCRQRVESLERLRWWCRAADALDPAPEPTGAWSPAEFLAGEAPPETGEGEGVPTTPVSVPGEGSAGGRRRFFRLPGFRPPPLRAAVGFAVVLVVIGAVATWYATRRWTQWVDVRDLRPLEASSATFPYEEVEGVDLYVIQHTTHQPWARYGDELPLIRQASQVSR